MKLNSASSLRDVVAEVGSVLARGSVSAVLTGGACASIYSRGIYQSADVDFILVSNTTRQRLDELLGIAGLHRSGDRYVHPEVRYYVEFPRGPLTIGSDDEIVPVEVTVNGRSFLALSTTDSCRDRLAAFYHWRDQQSFRVAVWIALQKELDLNVIRRWSAREGFAADYREFLSELDRVRAERSRRRATRRTGRRS